MLRFPLPNNFTISHIVHVLQPLPIMFDTSPFVTLISNDGFEFIVSRDAACVAGTIQKMLDPTSKPLKPPLRFVSTYMELPKRTRLYTYHKYRQIL